MKLHQVRVAGFRGFEQLELSFDNDVNVIAGVNGMGKSGILQALAVLFSRALPEFTPSNAKANSFTDEDIQYGKPAMDASAIFTVKDQRCHMAVQRVRGSAEGDRHQLLLENIRTTPMRTGGLDAAQTETQRVLQTLRGEPQQPLAIYFTTNRQLPGRPKVLPKPAPFEQQSAYPAALDGTGLTLREFMHWFRSQEVLIQNGDARRGRVLAALRRVVTTFIESFTDLRIEEEPLRFVVDKGGTPLALNQLSDGERGLLAILFDITRRLAIANPQLDDPISQGQAIVLIDEVELHLHPSWQRQVLRRFARTFKNCQFIVTSHSPQVIGQVKPESLHVIYREQPGRVTARQFSQSFGMDSNWVLQEIMSTSPRDHEIELKLRSIYEALDKDDLAAAREKTVSLEEEIGLFPELQEIKSMLDRLEILGSEHETDS